MNNETDNTQWEQTEDLTSDEYQRGLRILALMISRAHIKKELKKQERTNSTEKDNHENS